MFTFVYFRGFSPGLPLTARAFNDGGVGFEIPLIIMCVCVCVCVYIYMLKAEERGRDKEKEKRSNFQETLVNPVSAVLSCHTVHSDADTATGYNVVGETDAKVCIKMDNYPPCKTIDTSDRCAREKARFILESAGRTMRLVSSCSAHAVVSYI